MLVIKTARLILRPIEEGDIDTAHEYAGDEDNAKYMVHLPNRTKRETKEFVDWAVAEWKKDCPGMYEFAVTLNGRHIGGISATIDESGLTAELGWIINKSYHNMGYATEAAKAVLDFAVNDLKAEKIIAKCDYRNKASYAVMLKIGLTLESDDGIRPYKDNGEDVKELTYSLTAGG